MCQRLLAYCICNCLSWWGDTLSADIIDLHIYPICQIICWVIVRCLQRFHLYRQNGGISYSVLLKGTWLKVLLVQGLAQKRRKQFSFWALVRVFSFSSSFFFFKSEVGEAGKMPINEIYLHFKYIQIGTEPSITSQNFICWNF